MRFGWRWRSPTQSGEGKKEYNILLKSELRRIGNGDQFLSWSLDDDLGAKRRRERNTEL